MFSDLTAPRSKDTLLPRTNVVEPSLPLQGGGGVPLSLSLPWVPTALMLLLMLLRGTAVGHWKRAALHGRA